MTFAERLPSGLLAGWMTSPDPIVATVMATQSFDCVAIDMQHSNVDLEAATAMIPLIKGFGKPLLFRLPLDAFSVGAQLLDHGADGLIAQ